MTWHISDRDGPHTDRYLVGCTFLQNPCCNFFLLSKSHRFLQPLHVYDTIFHGFSATRPCSPSSQIKDQSIVVQHKPFPRAWNLIRGLMPAALLVLWSTHPGWSPAAIRSKLMTTTIVTDNQPRPRCSFKIIWNQNLIDRREISVLNFVQLNG